jgi:hypothetical protein
VTLAEQVNQLLREGLIVGPERPYRPSDDPVQLEGSQATLFDGDWPTQETRKRGLLVPPLSLGRPYACLCGRCIRCWKRERERARKQGAPKLRPGPPAACDCGTCRPCKTNARHRASYWAKRGLLAGRRPPTMANLGGGGQSEESAAC